MSYKLRDWDNNLTNSLSTETLGVGRAATETGGGKYMKMRKYLVLSVITVLVLLTTCVVLSVLLAKEYSARNSSADGGVNKSANERKRQNATDDQLCYTSECLQIAATFQRNMDESIDPCDDFYLHSCGSWIQNNPVPPSRNRYDTFIMLDNINTRKIRDLLEREEKLPSGSPIHKAKLYFKFCMNEEKVEATSLKSIHDLIRSHSSWALDSKTWNGSVWTWSKALLPMMRNMPLWSPLIMTLLAIDPQNSSQYTVAILPPELSLIRETYLSNDIKTKTAYLDYMTKVGELLGGDNTTTRDQMEKVMKLETRLAEIIPPRSVVYKNFFRDISLEDLQQKAPGYGFVWGDYLNEFLSPFNVWLNSTERIIVPSVEYLQNLSSVVKETDNRTLSNYMMWTLVRSAVPYLSRDFRDALLEYQIKAEGKKEATTRWLSCLEEMNGYRHGLTFALGYMYVNGVFDAEIIPYIEEMMANVKSTFREQVPRYEWIDEQTRPKIYEKEEAMKDKVGFPKLCANETLLNKYYEELNISGSSYLQNAMDVMQWSAKSGFSKLRSPVDKEQWFTGPQMVNAFYLPNRNEINILAGILQPPFYYGRKAPRAVNYGAIGMVLAHELSHGFDASGRFFNKNGEISSNWWSNYTSEGFDKRAQCMVDQYSRYYVDGEDGKKIQLDGNLTLSENIADNGGIRLAYWAYKNWVKKNGPEGLLPGLNKTNDQLLFVSFAQMWCSSFTPAGAYHLAKVDTHALAMFRVIGSLSNMEEFAKAFNCPAEKGMNPEKKCQVW